MQYRFTCDYISAYGAWNKGDIADLDDVTAQWLLRDVPDCIEPVTTERAVDKPKQTRQVTNAPKKRGV